MPDDSRPLRDPSSIATRKQGESGVQVDVVNEVLEAQSDLQTALGFLRLQKAEDGSEIVPGCGVPDDAAMDRLARALARLQRLLADLGKPMYQPAQHPDITGKAVR